MSSAAFLLAALGIIFIWAGVRGEDPRDLFAEAIRPGSSARAGSAGAKSAGAAALGLGAKFLPKKASNAPKGAG